MYSNKSLWRRIIALSIVFISLFGLLIVRLYVVQIKNSQMLQTKALDQWLRDVPTNAKRGAITDCNGQIIVSSYSVYNIYVKSSLVENIEKETDIYSEVLNLDKELVLKKLKDKSLSENLLINGASKAQLQTLIDSGIKSFVASESWSRNYNYNSLLSQVIGFTSKDGNGVSGLELEYNKYLSGVNGFILSDGDAGGKTLNNAQTHYIPSIDGFNIELTIDFMLQAELEKITANACTSTGAKSVSTMVMNPKNGEILAINSYPSFNLNEVPREDLDLLNKLSRSFIINDTYEPGSTFKTIVAAIGLDLGVTDINHSYYCPGYRIVDGVRTNCHKKTGHGPQTLTTGFINSCNCVFMQLVSDIGIDNFYNYLSKFHMDSYLNIDYPGEATGIIIDKNFASYNDFLRMGFGQSIAISGLQLASSIGAVITDGYLVKPHFVKSIYSNNGDLVYKSEVSKLEKVVDEKVIKDMQYIMEQVVLRGGGKASAVEGKTVGGKTGTAQKIDNGVVSKTNYIGSYICASPIEDPEYLVLVIVDEPKTSIYGNIVATPVAGDILKAIYKLKGEEISESEENKVVMPNVVGLSLTEAGSMLAGLGLYYVTEGDGKVVSYQSVKEGEKISVGSSIIIRF